MLIVEGHEIQLNKNLDNFTNDELFDFCVANKDLRIERDANQNIIIMSPVGGNSGFNEFKILLAIGKWEEENGGIGLSPSVGFLLPNGAMRCPDGCWMTEEKWLSISKEQREKFLPITPDFVVEIRSRTDSLKSLQNKMVEWIENGVRLGWLIDSKGKQTFIYRENGSIEIVEGLDKKLSGEDVMEGFEFDLSLLKTTS